MNTAKLLDANCSERLECSDRPQDLFPFEIFQHIEKAKSMVAVDHHVHLPEHLFGPIRNIATKHGMPIPKPRILSKTCTDEQPDLFLLYLSSNLTKD